MTDNPNWPECEKRIDIISRNGNGGEHYEILDKQNKGEEDGDNSESETAE